MQTIRHPNIDENSTKKGTFESEEVSVAGGTVDFGWNCGNTSWLQKSSLSQQNIFFPCIWGTDPTLHYNGKESRN